MTPPHRRSACHFERHRGPFACQAIAGLSFPIPNVPGLSLTAEYRFFGVLGGQNLLGHHNATRRTIPLKLQQQYNNSFLLGVRYAFGVAAASSPGGGRRRPPRRRRAPIWCSSIGTRQR